MRSRNNEMMDWEVVKQAFRDALTASLPPGDDDDPAWQVSVFKLSRAADQIDQLINMLRYRAERLDKRLDSVAGAEVEVVSAHNFPSFVADPSEIHDAASLCRIVLFALKKVVESVYNHTIKLPERVLPATKEVDEESVIEGPGMDLQNDAICEFTTTVRPLLYPSCLSNPQATRIPIALFGAAGFLLLTATLLEVGLTHGSVHSLHMIHNVVEATQHINHWVAHSNPNPWSRVGKGVAAVGGTGTAAAGVAYGAYRVGRWSWNDPLKQLTHSLSQHAKERGKSFQRSPS